MNLIIAESLRRFLELNRSKSLIAQILLDDDFTTVEFGNYIARRGDMLSFLPAGKEHQVNDNGDWRRENRQTARAGKLVRKLINEYGYTNMNPKDSDFELFSNLVKSDKVNDEDCKVRFELVKGEDIRYRYYEDNHSDKYNLGTMKDSCMRYGKCQDWLDLYVKNPNKVGLLVLLDEDNKTVGRALVWKLDSGETFMDRVYGTEAHQKMFESYAENRKWWYKSTHDNDQSADIVTPDGEPSRKALEVTLSYANLDRFPYMDTLSYYSHDGLITNASSSYDYELRDTEGYWEGHNDDDDDEDDNDGQVYDTYRCRYIDENGACYIEGFGYAHEDDCIYDEYTWRWNLNRDSERLENGKWCHEDDAIYVEDYGHIHKTEIDDYRQVDGKWYREDDTCWDEIGEEDILIKDSVELYTGGRTSKNHRGVVELDEFYGDKQYALTSDCFVCPHSGTYYLTEDSVVTYCGTRVAQENLRNYLEEHEEETGTPTENQLTLELIDHG
jgi:hypothetical protein